MRQSEFLLHRKVASTRNDVDPDLSPELKEF